MLRLGVSVRTLSKTAVQQQSRFQTFVNSARPNVKEITPAEAASVVKNSQDGPLLIDVREDHEWERARIANPNVVHVSKGVLERDIEKVVPDVEKPIILYCAGGVRSLLAADVLSRMGYKNVKSLAGGLSGWAQQGLPVDTKPSQK